MSTFALARPVVACLVAVLLARGAGAAEKPDASFYKAYYLEKETGNLEQAAELYAKAIEGRRIDPDLRARAQARLAAVREDLRCSDFARLAPPDTMVYLEMNRPGAQLRRLLSMLGLSLDRDNQSPADGPRIGISSELVDELFGLRGAAVAITGVDIAKQMPMGVAILHPGNHAVLRGLIETALPFNAQPVKPIQGFATYLVEKKAFVCLTSRLVVVSTQRPQIVAVMRRLEGKDDQSLATNPELANALAGRDEALGFFCINTRPIMPLVTSLLQAAGGSNEEFRIANAVLDLNNLRSVTGQFGVGRTGPFFELAVRMDDAQRNLAYNLLRTPPFSREGLACVPAGAAAFGIAALSPATEGAPGAQPGRPTSAITGLDFGREIFANIRDVAFFLLPPEEAGERSGPPIPDVAMVMKVNDPARSDALWTQILGLISLATGAPTTEGETDTVNGLKVRTFQMPEGIKVYFSTAGNTIVVSPSRRALAAGLAAARGASSVLQDEAFASALQGLTSDSSKAMFAHLGRCATVAQAFSCGAESKEIEQAAALLTETVASVVTDEAPGMFRLRAAVAGLPDVSGMVVAMLQQQRDRQEQYAQLAAAQQRGKWDDALAALDAIEAQHDQSTKTTQKRFEVLAVGTRDHAEAVRAGKQLVERTDDATALNNFAWSLLTDERYRGAYHDLALTAAEKCHQLTAGRIGAFLDTYARARFEAGEIDAAVDLQQRAVAAYGDEVPAAIHDALRRYEEARRTEGTLAGSDP